MVIQLWVEKYRPRKVDEYVFTDEKQKEQILTWIQQKSIPHLLLSGSAGVGKTTLAKVLFNELEINDLDILEINASRENSVEIMRDKITSFVSTMPFGEFKVVLLDEADYLSANAQAILRGVMETYSSTARFILTANYPHRIIPAIHSRCQGFHVEKPNKDEFTARLVNVLVEEGLDLDKLDWDILDTYVQSTYPDLRKAINMLQPNFKNGVLSLPSSKQTTDGAWRIKMVELFKANKINEARKLVCQNAQPEELESIYRWMYENLDLWSNTDDGKNAALLYIRDALVNHTICADAEINFSACCAQLARLK